VSSTLGGYVWAPAWSGIGEGPYTLAAKILNANNLRTRYLKKGILWRQGKGASLLDPCPTSNDEMAAALGRMLYQASLAARIPRLYKELATDRELRYCTKCISSGFQAAIAQILGIDRCPIHGEIHRNACMHCGTKTEPYFLDDNHLPSFSCKKCGSPLGGDTLIDRRVDAWATPEHVKRLDPIHLWLERVNASKDIHWINVSGWSATRQAAIGSRDHTRYAVFGILRSQLLPDEAVPESNLDQKPEVFGPFPLAPSAKSSAYLTQAEYDNILRRMVLPASLNQYSKHFRTPSFGVAVPVSHLVPPHLHAHLIWRAQFEKVTSIFSEPYSRSGFCSVAIPKLLNTKRNPLEIPISNRSISEGILMATWSASLKIAIDWHQMQISFWEVPLADAEQRWLIAVDQWANRLGCWRNRDYFPIAVIKVKDTITGEDQLYFVVA
jgi:hypothetical protein